VEIVEKWKFRPPFYIAPPYPIPFEEEETLWRMKNSISTPTLPLFKKINRIYIINSIIM